MIELKVEVGKKYVDSNSNIVRCVGYDEVKNVYIAVDNDGVYNHYQENGVALSSDYFVYPNRDYDIHKEHKEPKTVSGWVNVFQDYDRRLSFGYLFETKKEASAKAEMSPRYLGIIHLDNIEIEEV